MRTDNLHCIPCQVVDLSNNTALYSVLLQCERYYPQVAALETATCCGACTDAGLLCLWSIWVYSRPRSAAARYPWRQVNAFVIFSISLAYSLPLTLCTAEPTLHGSIRLTRVNAPPSQQHPHYHPIVAIHPIRSKQFPIPPYSLPIVAIPCWPSNESSLFFPY